MVWRRKIVSDGADFLIEVIRKDIRKVVRLAESNVEGRGENLLLPRMVLKF